MAIAPDKYMLEGGGVGEYVEPKPVTVEPKLTYQSNYTDPQTGDIIDVYIDENGKKVEKLNKQGTVKRDEGLAAAAAAAEKRRAGQSAYDILYGQFKQYNLQGLIEPLKKFIQDGLSEDELTLKLRETPDYQKRFAANAERINKGLSALSEAEYIAKEDAYQNLMRQYGLPASYYTKNAIGTQEGFEKLLANDVSGVELENRLQQAADILDKSPAEYLRTLQTWYPEIARADLMAYVLDPKNAISQITTKINAGKIGGEYLRAGLSLDQNKAEEFLRQGVTAEKARTGAQAVKETAPRGGELAAMYGESPYGQTDVEAEVYGLSNAAEAKKKRLKLTGLEEASFGKKSGVGVLDANRAGAY